MASGGDGEKKGFGLGDLFARKPDKPEETGEEKLTERKLIIPLIQTALADGCSVSVQLIGEKAPCYSFFALDEQGGGSYLNAASHLLLAPLDPPIGNLRIRRAPLVTIGFFTNLFMAEAKVRFQQVRPDRNLEMSFPQEIARSKQKRLASRYKVPPGFTYQMLVTRPSGIAFEGVIIDISHGGMAFYAKSQKVARLDEGATVALEITRGGMDRTIRVEAKVLGALQKDGQPCFRAQFRIKTQEVLVLVKRFVDAVAREQLAHRDKMFNS